MGSIILNDVQVSKDYSHREVAWEVNAALENARKKLIRELN